MYTISLLIVIGINYTNTLYKKLKSDFKQKNTQQLKLYIFLTFSLFSNYYEVLFLFKNRYY